jgi:hypothetical protein
MVGNRIAPDASDIVVWRLDEAAAPFVNSSSSPSAPSHTDSDLTTLSGTVLLQQPSPFAASGTNSCIQLIGNNSGSPRNYIGGANNFLPQPPITVSAWYYQRAYDTTGFTQHGLTKQTTTGTWSGSTFGAVDLAQNERYNGSGIANTSRFDFYFQTNSSNQGGNANTFADLSITLHNWCHIGMTYDGTTVISYINGNVVNSATASPGGNIYYSGSPGPWFIGAIPSGSGNPEEGQFGMCDVRIANVVRPQSYFKNVYNSAILNVSVVQTFYKMRAYDLSCSPPSAIYWVDTVVSYTNAPTAPCGGALSPIEIVESWTALSN